VIPNCISYDPCFGYELAVIIHHGLKRMLEEQHDEFYYITLMNEDYAHPPLPDGVEEGIVRGLYRLRDGRGTGTRVRLLGSGTILRQVLMAGDLLEEQFGIAADVFSVTSFTELRREAMACDRQALYHPDEPPPKPYVTAQLEYSSAPVIAASDYLRTYSDQIRAWVPGRYVTLGTDGFGRSDGRAELRTFFEVDAHHIAWAALKTLHDEGAISGEQLERAKGELAVDRQRPAPWTV
jgi:pyruvate dehydrogenase E1 component